MMDTYVTYLPSGWHLVEKLGEGSYGIVYRAQRMMGAVTEEAAIKHISIPKNDADLNSIVDDVGGTQDDVNRYLTQLRDLILDEYGKMANLQGHTNIVACQDVECYPKQDGVGYDVYIRMELLESVSKRIREGKMDREETIKLGMDICCALDLLCQNRIIHRDIKPQNLFVNANGDYKLGDFGTARSIAGTSTMMSVKGTFAYMAPEVMLNQKVSYASDIYSLGLVMYRLMNGNKPPFIHPGQAGSVTNTDAAATKRLQGVVLPPPAYADPELAEIILKACSFKPQNRWQSAAEMHNALLDICGTIHREPLLPPAPEEPVEEPPMDEPVSDPPRKGKWWAGVLILLLMAGCLLGYLLAEGKIVWPPEPSPSPRVVTPTPTPVAPAITSDGIIQPPITPTPTPTATLTPTPTPKTNNHSYKSVITKAATCGATGIRTYTCSKCGDSYTDTIPKTDDHSYKYVVTKAATCGATGVRTYTCSKCGDSYTDTIPKTDDHSYKYVVTKAATCGATGVRTYTCSKCGDSYTTTISKTDDHSYKYVVTKAATCGATGVRTYTCSKCGNSYTTTIPKTDDHSYTSTVTKEATCGAEGVTTFTCTRCGDKYTKSIPKTTHVNVEKGHNAKVVNRYEAVDSEYHRVIYDVHWWEYCYDCHSHIDEYWLQEDELSWHQYQRRVCSLCGYDNTPDGGASIDGGGAGAYGGGGGGFR